MKKVLVVVVVFVMVFALAACSSGNSGSGGGAAAPPSTGGGGGTTAPPSTGGGGSGEPVKLIFATSVVERGGTSQDISWMVHDYIVEHSNGEIEMEIYGNSLMGGDVEIVESLQAGRIQGWFGAPATVANFNKDISVLELPFSCYNVEEVKAVVATDSTVFKALSDSLWENNLSLRYMTGTGFRTTWSAKGPIYTPQDLEGFKIRILENENFRLMWEAVGARPTIVALAEVYTAVEQGLVDGFDNPPEPVYVNGFGEIFPWGTETCSVFGSATHMLSRPWLESLTDFQRQVVEDAYNYAAANAPDAAANQAAFRERLTDEFGTEIHFFTPADVDYLRDKTESVWDKIRSEINPEIYDAFMKTLEEIRG